MSINPNSEDVQLNNLLNANKPYTFSVNRSTLVEQARQVWNDVADLEADFCPDNFAQASITMHPAYSSRTDFSGQIPSALRIVLRRHTQGLCFPSHLDDFR